MEAISHLQKNCEKMLHLKKNIFGTISCVLIE